MNRKIEMWNGYIEELIKDIEKIKSRIKDFEEEVFWIKSDCDNLIFKLKELGTQK